MLYGGGVERAIGRKAVMMGIYLVLIGVTFGMFKTVPGGFVPGQDKQYLVGFAQLPDGATLDRTEDVIRRMSEIALKQPGVEAAVAFPGLSINGFTNSSNAGIVFASLKPFEERKTADLSGGAIAMQLNQKYAGIKEAFIAMFPPPPVAGLGTIGGFKLQIEDRAGLGYDALDEATKAFLAKARAAPELVGLFSSYQVNVPQLYADLDRTKARQLSVAMTDVFDTLQIYLGSLYVNDFNKFGRTYSVRVQADAQYRARADDVGRLQVRSNTGEMVPLAALLKVSSISGPERAMRYNGFLSADINGNAAPGFSYGRGAGRGRAHRGGNPAARLQLRVDRADVSGNSGGQFRAGGLSARDPAGVPGAGGAVREPRAAAVDHHDRADGSACGHDRRLADRRRQQRVHPDRSDRAGRPVGEERHPDRRVRARAGVRRQAHRSRRRSRRAACDCARS